MRRPVLPLALLLLAPALLPSSAGDAPQDLSASLTPLPPGLEGEVLRPREPLVAGDLDGDGGTDILILTTVSSIGVHLEARRGVDGALLWRRPLLDGGAYEAHLRRDLDGDGAPDALLVHHQGAQACNYGCQSSWLTTLTALRGADGATLWTRSEAPALNAGRAYALVAEDHDADGGADILLQTRQGCPTPPACPAIPRAELVHGATGATLHARNAAPGVFFAAFVPAGDAVGGPGPDLLWRESASCGGASCQYFEMVEGAAFTTAWAAFLPTRTYATGEDLDGDGDADLLTDTGSFGGVLTLRDGATGAALWSVPGAGGSFGPSVVGPLGGGPGADVVVIRAVSSLVRAVERIDGATGATLLTTHLTGFGSWWVEAVGDHDGDGARDLLLTFSDWAAGASPAPTPLDSPPLPGKLYVETAAGVRTHVADSVGHPRAFAGALDGDGRDDLLIVDREVYVQGGLMHTRALAGPVLAALWSASETAIGAAPFYAPRLDAQGVPDASLDGFMDLLVYRDDPAGPTTYEMRDGVTGAALWTYVTG